MNYLIRFPFFVFFLVFCLPFSFPTVTASQVIASDQTAKIYVKKGRSRNYYHMEYVLTEKNLIMSDFKSELTLINAGGHFSIFIKKEEFPLVAPNCEDNIELDMPWTKSTRISALKKISKKTALYQSLVEVVKGNKKDQKVVIELNPNIAIKHNDPLEIELTKCNVYFRTARDAYIDYVGGLK